MHAATVYMTAVILLTANILRSDGAGKCSCKCCAGNFCTATLQGTIDVSSCQSASCEALCKQQYPLSCVDGSGSATYQCSSSSTPDSTPNWFGTFNMQGKCDRTVCCCPVGNFVTSRVNANRARAQGKFLGRGCPVENLSIDEEVSIPDGYRLVILFMGEPIQLLLSQDSNSMQLSNEISPECSETAIRSKTVSYMKTNLSLISFLVGLLTMIHGKM